LPSVPLHRRQQLFWLAPVGLLCLFPLFFIGGPGWSDGPLLRAAWNLGHPIFFALLTVTVRPWRFVSGWKLWAVATVAVFVLGLGVEFAQSLDSRDVDSRDVFRNLTGLWIVLALRPRVGFPQPGRLRDWLIRIAAIGLLSIDLVVVSRIGIQQFQINLWLPALYDFEQEHPERYWRGNVARSTGDTCGPLGDGALTIDLTTRRYSGASLDNLPSDWEGYEELAFALWNPQSYAISLTLRINDMAHELGNNTYHDRFNRTFQIEPGINRLQQSLDSVVTSPRSRQMELDDIRRLMFFTSNLDQPARLCLGELRLKARSDADDGLH